jgi:hypothetical protein
MLCLWCNALRTAGSSTVNGEALRFCSVHRADHEALMLELGAWRARRKARAAAASMTAYIESTFGRRRRFTAAP